MTLAHVPKVTTAGLVMLLALSRPAWAANFNVNDFATLSAAIANAADGDTITFTGNITLTGDLPAVQTSVTIIGANHTLDGAGTYRGFLVANFNGGSTLTAVTVAIQDLTITDTKASGGTGGNTSGGGAGLGGAIFVADQANVTVSNVSLTSNQAVGGNGSDTSIGFGGSLGGGGGMGGNGGIQNNNAAGGGGGIGAGANGGAGNGVAGQSGIVTGANGGGSGASGGSGGVSGGGGGGGLALGDAGGGGGVGGGNAAGTAGGAGGFGGGGGGGMTGGAGGFGGGGGFGTTGGAGGFGGGGAGGGGGGGGAGGFAGGSGGSGGGAGGGGGAGLGGAIFVQSGGNLIIAGTLSVNGNTVTAGNGAASGTAGSAFGAGIFIQGNNTITFSPASGTQTVSDVIADQTGSGGSGGNAGAGALAKTGAGTLVLTGANTYTGGTTVSGGLVNFTAGNNLGTGNITLNGGGLQWAAGNTTDISARLNAIGASGATIDTNGNDVSFATGLSGGGGLTKSGAGILTLSGTNTYTGATTVDAGTLRLGSAGALGATSGVVLNPSGTLDLNGFSTSAGSLTGTGTVALGGATFTLGAGNVSSTFAGSITGNGAVVKTGAGTFTLAGSNSYTGTTTIEAGTLRAGAAGALGTSNLTIDAGATLDLNGFSLSAGGVAGTGTVALGGATFTLGAGGASSTFAGSITGSGTVAKTGGGTLTLSGVNSYAGPTVVGAGTLMVGSASALGAGGSLTVESAGTLNLQGFSQTFGQVDGAGTIALGGAMLTLGAGGATSTFAGRITGAGSLTKTGAGTLTLAGANTYTGGTQVNGGTLVGTTTSLHGAVTNNAALAFDQAFDGTFLGTVSGAGPLAKRGTGSLTLTGTNPMTGTTTVQQGELVLNGSLGGSVIVGSGASFTGTGSIGGSLTAGAGGGSSGLTAQTATLASGWVARPVTFVPASAVPSDNATVSAHGALAVGGDLTIGAGGTYQVTIAADGTTSALTVGGTAALAGGLIDVESQSGQTARMVQTEILSAAGGLTGTPTVQISDPALEGYTATDGHAMVLLMLDESVPLAPVATSANGEAAGHALDTVKLTTSDSDLRAVTRELTALDDPDLAGALDQVSGEIHATAVQLAASDTEATGDAVRAEIAARGVAVGADGTRGVTGQPWVEGHRWWARLLGQHGTFDASGGAYPATASLGGFAIGTDWTLGAGWLAGAGGGYTRGTITLDGLDQSSRMTTPGAFGYLGYGRGRWTAHVGGRVARSSYDTTRGIAFAAHLDPRFGSAAIFSGVNRTATSAAHGVDAAAWGEWTFEAPAGAWLIEPQVGLRYARYGRDAWTEDGAGAISLAADAQTIASAQVTAGARFARRSGRVRPYADALYARELGAGDTDLTLRLSSEPAGSFTVSGVPFAANRLLGAVGLTTAMGSGSDLTVGYRIDTGSTGTRHAVDFGVRF